MRFKVGDRLISTKVYMKFKGIKIPFKGVVLSINESDSTAKILITQSPGVTFMSAGRTCEETRRTIGDWELDEDYVITATSLYDKLNRERFKI